MEKFIRIDRTGPSDRKIPKYSSKVNSKQSFLNNHLVVRILYKFK